MTTILDNLRSYQTPNLREIAADQAQALRAFQDRIGNQTPAASGNQTAVEPRSILAAYIEQVSKVPPAKYALPRADGGLDFLEVVERSNGRRYVNRLHGAPGSWRREQMSYRLMWHAARHLAQDPAGAAKRFADEHRVCARCESPLTEPLSRATGLGPVCRRSFI